MRPIPSLAALVLAAGPLAAQATITGRVRHDSTNAPLAGAEIVFEGGGLRAESDSSGRFRITRVPTGVSFATVRKIGFRPVRLRAVAFAADTIEVEVRLHPAAVELPPIEVTATAVPPGMEPFAERRAAGFGRFVDSKALRASEHRRLADVLGEGRGIRTVMVGGTKVIATSMRAGRHCPMAIWLDGLKIWAPGGRFGPPPDLNDYQVDQLEAIEIYAGEAETPSEFGGPGAGCGTLVFWSRRP